MFRLTILATLVLAGCAASSVAPTSPINRETTIAQGRTVSVAEGVSVHFVGVSGDSRCPADAFCIQGGDAIVKLRVTASGDGRDVELHTGNTQAARAGTLTVELLQLAPYPFSSRTIRPDEYQATIRVTR